MAVKSDIEIAREASMRPITEVGAKLDIPGDALLQYGPSKAKISYEFIRSLEGRPDGKLILVTAVTPTPAGEGKTTTTVGLGDGLNRIGKRATVCVREPSLGPCFGMKGGAAGGGYAQVVPMEDINLHFTGDFHAIGIAHNLLAAMVDNHIHWGNALGIDVRRVAYRRVVDMNDRALRQIVQSLGGIGNGYPRQDGFDITVASEVMAIFCLATSLEDLTSRIGNIIVGYTRDRTPVRANQLKAHEAMAVLLKDALMAPNLVQTLREQSGLRAWRTVRQYRPRLQLGDRHPDRPETGRLCCHRSGFRRRSGRGEILRHQMPQGRPQTRCGDRHRRHRAGAQDAWRGAAQGRLDGAENVEAVRRPGSFQSGDVMCENVGKKFGVQPVGGRHQPLPIPTRTPNMAGDRATIAPKGSASMRHRLHRHWADGGAGVGGARQQRGRSRSPKAASRASSGRLYRRMTRALWDKISHRSAREIYRRRATVIGDHRRSATSSRSFEADLGYGHLPVCMAKTQYSVLDRPAAQGRAVEPRRCNDPRGPAIGRCAEFVVVVCRRDHDHARPAARAGRRIHPPRRSGFGAGPILGCVLLQRTRPLPPP